MKRWPLFRADDTGAYGQDNVRTCGILAVYGGLAGALVINFAHESERVPLSMHIYCEFTYERGKGAGAGNALTMDLRGGSG